MAHVDNGHINSTTTLWTVPYDNLRYEIFWIGTPILNLSWPCPIHYIGVAGITNLKRVECPRTEHGFHDTMALVLGR